jgi:hypothetical protein
MDSASTYTISEDDCAVSSVSINIQDGGIINVNIVSENMEELYGECRKRVRHAYRSYSIGSNHQNAMYMQVLDGDGVDGMLDLVDSDYLYLPENLISEIYEKFRVVYPDLIDPFIQETDDIIAQIGKLSPEQVIQEIELCNNKERIYRKIFTKFQDKWYELGPDLLILLVNSSNHGKKYRLDVAEYLLAEQRPKDAYVMLDELADEYSNTLRVRIVEVMMGMPMRTLTPCDRTELTFQLIEMFKLS